MNRFLQKMEQENCSLHVRCWLSIILVWTNNFIFRSDEWRTLRNLESNFKQIFTTSWNWSLKIHFMGGKHRTFLYFNLEVFGDLMHLVKLYSCKYIIWRVLTDNIIGKPDTLSLNMPLDILSLERASYAWYCLAA